MGYLKAYYERIVSLPEEEWKFIASFFRKKVLPRKAVLTETGKTECDLSFIEKGMIRFYIPEEKGELTFNFSFAGQFSCAYDSFLTQTPSDYELQTLSDTILWQISYEDLQKVYAKTRVGNYLGRFAAEQLFLAKSRRERFLLRYNATERYLRLMEEKPDYIRQVPQKYLASYIGISPQSLSRIRKQIC